MDGRQERGLQIAALAKIEHTRVGWKVPSQTGNGTYVVQTGDQPFCTCPDFEARGLPCKHIFAVEYVIQRETKPDGTTTYTESIRVTYGQNWHTYHRAQINEERDFTRLLQALCDGIEQPAQTRGRRRAPLSDVVFALASKTYSTLSGRRAMSGITDVLADAPSFQTAFRYLESPDLTPLLKDLIAQSAEPLKAVEADFAADSTGFATSTYERWYDHKRGKVRSEAKWIKCHIMTGVKTNIITAIEATTTQSSDMGQFPYLVNETAKRFSINEVSADKAYSSRKSLQAVQAVGGVPFIPFQKHATGRATHHYIHDELWSRMWHFYNFNRAAFLEHYHKRSNVETTFSMVKAKFGGSVRAKTPTAQVNEVLLKALCHNIVVLVQSIYELGIQPQFHFATKEAPVSKVRALNAF